MTRRPGDSRNWGGFRAKNPGGRPPGKKDRPDAPRQVAKVIAGAAAEPAAADAKPRKRISWDAVARIVESTRQNARHRPRTPEWNPFRIAEHPPHAMPPKKFQMAMDNGLTANNNWAANAWLSGGILTNISSEGLLFLGYPYLAELAQRPEYRVISDTIATEMTRKWIRLKAVGKPKKDQGEQFGEDRDMDAFPEPGESDEDDQDPNKTGEGNDKTDKIKELTDELDRLGIRDAFKTIATQDGLFGRAHLYLDFGADLDDMKGEMATSIGDGRNDVSKGKIGKGSFRAVRPIEAVWCYPTTYNANNPLKPDWYNPRIWYVMGKQIDQSRMPTFIGRPVPDLLKPAYSFGGLSLSQLALPYVRIWLDTREAIAELIQSFSQMVLKTNLATSLMPGGSMDLAARVATYNALRTNSGTVVIDKDTEDFANISAPLSGLNELQAQAQEHMASVARIPLVKFTGISPAGLNASSEGEMRAFYDTINAFQESFFRPNLTKIIHFAMLSLWGEVDEEITFDFVPLWALTEKEEAEVEKIKAETDDLLVNGVSAFSPEEVRKRVISDPDSPYANADPEDVPDPPDPMEAMGGGKIDLKGNAAFGSGPEAKGALHKNL